MVAAAVSETGHFCCQSSRSGTGQVSEHQALFENQTFSILNSCIQWFCVKVQPVNPENLGVGGIIWKMSLEDFQSVGQN